MVKRLILISFLMVAFVFANTDSSFKVANDKGKDKIAKFYKKKCSKCHGKAGEGIKRKKKKPPINTLAKISDEKVFKIIRKGYKGKIGKMPKFKTKKINDADLKALVTFVKAFDKSKKKK